MFEWVLIVFFFIYVISYKIYFILIIFFKDFNLYEYIGFV